MSAQLELVMRLVVDGDRQDFRIIERNGEMLISLGTVHDGEPSLKADTFRRFSLQPEGRCDRCSTANRVLVSTLEIVEVKR
jgi:hypothetical protein